ncbi:MULTISPECIES: hypothetical protein [unclassified Fibrobacter]|uniref:hypothetical protein n=1 Tax=unclassified Fibrobacter TaxID=2634177 RepID=UPI000D6D1F6A|nr:MULTISPECIES: hypothetical protein [unclassified Fibrobacter]PWJ68123.1 hypothetical protein BGX12_11049 [Fibrobacter sp. UWR4]PZW71858.1 hypothetical protein C8E88_100950 [Fibrobacter sp. UWR1]
MNKFMKTALVSAAVVAAGSALVACASGNKMNKPETFQNKTGVIGVFRQAAFYCSDIAPQYMTLGDSKILVKPSWSSEQDNLFFSEMKPGIATLYSYEYTCSNEETKLVLDTADNGKKAFPVSVKVPESGFCKIVISFLENDNLFNHDDDMLSEQFMQNEVALKYSDVPYCDVIDTKGNVVSFMDRDSLNRANYETALAASRSLTAEDAYPLVALDGRGLAQTSGDNSQVVLVTWHNDPDKYRDGATIKLDGETLWAFADKEFLKWFQENSDKVTNWNLRLKQLFGKAPNYDAGYFTVYWANVKDVFRPAYVPETGDVVMNGAFSSSFEEDTSDNAMWFKNWFQETEHQAKAREGGFMWTRLGYTYDWGRTDGGKYGLTEFIVKDGAEIEVKFTRSTKGFLNWIKDRKF